MKRWLLLALALAGCVGEDDLVEEPAVCPDRVTFDFVAPVLEARCGSLDCHGHVGRPFIVYGRNGLRRAGSGMDDDPGYRTGGDIGTTDYENDGTYRSACGLEPELLELVVTQQEPATSLTLVRKPRLDEKHKGGRVWESFRNGDVCWQSWLEGGVDVRRCQNELRDR